MLIYLLIFSWVVCGAAFSVPFLWPARKILLTFGVLANVSAAFGLLAGDPNIFGGLLALVSLYLAFNLFRVFEQRMNKFYMREATQRTGLVLIIFQILLSAGWLAWQHVQNVDRARHVALLVWLAFALSAALITFVSTIWNVIKSKAQLGKDGAGTNFPTLSVCLPARNETEDLEACLKTLVASDYPKLEILVLDDCSQTRRTPEIIRSFAHDGVQFVAGTEPQPHWLAKNWAYEQLLKEANGELVLFCGVDTRFEPDSLRLLVTVLLSNKKHMMVVVPERAKTQYFSLLQPMRYFWELALPRDFFKRPAVLSTCWLAGRQELIELGGFSAVTRSIVPEAYFARRLASLKKYSFVRSAGRLGVLTRKTRTEQRATAVRTRYPQLHRRPEWVLLLSLVELTLLVAPFALFVDSFWLNDTLVLALAAAASGLLIAAYETVVLAVAMPNAALSLEVFPFVVLADFVVLYVSMYKYEFSVVEWKNRNICIPAMHVVPSLPSVEKEL